MNDTMNDTINNLSNISEQIDIWMCIALVELILIVFLLMKIKKGKVKWQENLSRKEQFKQDALKEEIDFGNIIQSSFHAQQLYDKLKIKCHPDRFPNDAEKNEIANEIFQEIAKNKRNYKKLLELKAQAEQQLNINI
ncbi:MAG: hypothetical protein LBP63_01470 [Prevotellaceae bacterium]|jgi:hypothetical protein|nr:hypothetical protein [Prevotellaceae bacterium]